MRVLSFLLVRAVDEVPAAVNDAATPMTCARRRGHA